MRLVKLNKEHYIIVDDSEIKEGDWTYHHVKGVYKAKVDGAYTNQNKITHSTIPKGMMLMEGIERLSLQEVKELIGEVDVENRAESRFGTDIGSIRGSKEYDLNTDLKRGFVSGYNQALEDNKEKKYTEEDIINAWEAGMQFIGEDKGSFGEFFQSLQLKTEWEVELIDGQLKQRQ